MKIAFTSSGPDWDSIIDPRFGRADYIVMYDEDSGILEVLDNSAVKNEAHGAGTATAQKMFDLSPDVLITGNGPGGNASSALRKMNLKIFVNAHNHTLKEAYESFKHGKLQEI
jgi:predicted Fe-Mo cluster-binding NifX family protein